MKKLILLLTFVTSLNLLSGQTNQTMSFVGYQQSVYQQPMMIGNHWDAMYENSDIIYLRGQIIIYDKYFEVAFANGTSWIADIKKKETKTGMITYRGIWRDNQDDAKLTVTEAFNYQHTLKVYSHRITNTGVSGVVFNDWECYRKITTFLN